MAALALRKLLLLLGVGSALRQHLDADSWDWFSTVCSPAEYVGDSFIEATLKLGDGVPPPCWARHLETAHRLVAQHFRTSLTVDEVASIYAYTDDCSEDLNELLLNATDDAADQRVCSYGWLLIRSMAKLPPYRHGTVYRGISGIDAEVLPQVRAGDVLNWRSFTSTSVHRSVAEIFARRGIGRIFVITLTSTHARLVGDFTENPSEQEVLLPPGTQVMVERVERLLPSDESSIEEVVHVRELETASPINLAWLQQYEDGDRQHKHRHRHRPF